MDLVERDGKPVIIYNKNQKKNREAEISIEKEKAKEISVEKEKDREISVEKEKAKEISVEKKTEAEASGKKGKTASEIIEQFHRGLDILHVCAERMSPHDRKKLLIREFHLRLHFDESIARAVAKSKAAKQVKPEQQGKSEDASPVDL